MFAQQFLQHKLTQRCYGNVMEVLRERTCIKCTQNCVSVRSSTERGNPDLISIMIFMRHCLHPEDICVAEKIRLVKSMHSNDFILYLCLVSKY